MRDGLERFELALGGLGWDVMNCLCWDGMVWYEQSMLGCDVMV